MRKLSIEEAKARYINRFTLDHVPAWARQVNPGNGKFYAPQYESDAQWYERTFFAGESELATRRHCYSTCPSWPLGQWLDQPFSRANQGRVTQ